jgi:probable HAF family extracellular repeat protein
MRNSSRPRIWVLLPTALTLVLAAATSAASAASAAPAAPAAPAAQGTEGAPAYRIIDLGTLGGENSFATAINDRGVVVGRSQTADGTYHGFRWRRGVLTDLGPFSPSDINNRGQIVGTRDDTTGAYLWRRGTLVRLGTLAFPYAINDRGQVVGTSAVAGGVDVPARWSRGTVRRLPLDSVSDINNRGQISGGRLSGATGFHASVWHRGRVTDLGAAAFDRSNTYRLNDRGWVIGWTFTAEQYERGALWRRGIRTDLGTLGGNVTTPVAINDRGVILVRSQLADGNLHPALWRRGRLTDLIPAGLDPHGEVADYNNRGEIAGTLRPDVGGVHAVVYRPKPLSR